MYKYEIRTLKIVEPYEIEAENIDEAEKIAREKLEKGDMLVSIACSDYDAFKKERAE